MDYQVLKTKPLKTTLETKLMLKVCVYFVFFIGFLVGAINTLDWYGEYKERKIMVPTVKFLKSIRGLLCIES